jgi:hypothetical protein
MANLFCGMDASCLFLSNCLEQEKNVVSLQAIRQNLLKRHEHEKKPIACSLGNWNNRQCTKGAHNLY